MNLKEKELLAQYQTILHHGDKYILKNTTYFLSDADWFGNSPPIGFLWAMKYNPPQSLDKPVTDTFIGQVEPMNDFGEVLGVVNIFTKKFIPKDYIPLPDLLNIPDEAAIVKLYHEMFPKKSFWDKLFRRNK